MTERSKPGEKVTGLLAIEIMNRSHDLAIDKEESPKDDVDKQVEMLADYTATEMFSVADVLKDLSEFIMDVLKWRIHQKELAAQRLSDQELAENEETLQ